MKPKMGPLPHVALILPLTIEKGGRITVTTLAEALDKIHNASCLMARYHAKSRLLSVKVVRQRGKAPFIQAYWEGTMQHADSMHKVMPDFQRLPTQRHYD